jgi:4'-phosphopantetheinyl transferase EntD
MTTGPAPRSSATSSAALSAAARAARLAAVLEHLLPPGVAAAAAVLGDDTSLLPAEAACVADAVAARRREFAAGRRAARAALARIGVVDALPLLPDEDRVPRWPAGVIGSISHGADVAVAAVTPAPRLRGLGVDVDGDAPLPDELHRMVLSEREQRSLVSIATRALDLGAHTRLLFSIKESVYKCVFPLTRAPFDFGDVDVEFVGVDGFVAHLGTRARFPPRAVRGRFAGEAGVILAVATV